VKFRRRRTSGSRRLIHDTIRARDTIRVRRHADQPVAAASPNPAYVKRPPQPLEQQINLFCEIITRAKRNHSPARSARSASSSPNANARGPPRLWLMAAWTPCRSKLERPTSPNPRASPPRMLASAESRARIAAIACNGLRTRYAHRFQGLSATAAPPDDPKW